MKVWNNWLYNWLGYIMGISNFIKQRCGIVKISSTYIDCQGKSHESLS